MHNKNKKQKENLLTEICRRFQIKTMTIKKKMELLRNRLEDYKLLDVNRFLEKNKGMIIDLNKKEIGVR